MRMGLPKSIIKKYGMTKKAWQVFRGSKGKKKASPKKRSRRRAVAVAKKEGSPTRHKKPGGIKMARRKKSVRRAARRVVGRARRVGRRIKSASQTRPGKILMAAGEVGAGMVLGTALVNKAMSTSSPTIKSGVKAAAGLAGLFLQKNNHVRFISGGLVLSAAVDFIGPMVGLAGPGNPSAPRTLSAAQLRAIAAGTMGVPADIRMNVPSDVRMNYSAAARGVSSSGWGNRSW